MKAILATISFFIFTSTANSHELLDIEIPLIEKHKNLSKQVNKAFYNKSVTFEVSLNNTQYISKYYDKWLTESGWIDPLKNPNFPVSPAPNQNWNSYRADYTDNNPKIIYGKHWENKKLRSIAAVTAEVTGFNKDMFNIRVTVSLAPKINPNGLFKLNSLVMEHPSNIFILSELLGSNPLDLTSVNIKEAEKHQGNGLVRKYLDIVKEIEIEFQTWANN